MGYRKKNLLKEDHTISSNCNKSLSEAMLAITMSIIGLPVDVHVKDGSVYSGIFFTASTESNFGILFFFIHFFTFFYRKIVYCIDYSIAQLGCEKNFIFLDNSND